MVYACVEHLDESVLLLLPLKIEVRSHILEVKHAAVDAVVDHVDAFHYEDFCFFIIVSQFNRVSLSILLFHLQ